MEVLEELLDKARRGEVTGTMLIASTPSGYDEIAVCGAFADRLEHAVFAASKALASLVEHQSHLVGVGHTSTEAIREKLSAPMGSATRLPRLLRPNYSKEESTWCSSST